MQLEIERQMRVGPTQMAHGHWILEPERLWSDGARCLDEAKEVKAY